MERYNHHFQLLAIISTLLLLLLSFNLYAQESTDSFKGFIQKHFPETFSEQRSQFGLKRQSNTDTVTKKQSIILIHGLDDPGKVWMNLRPVLVNQGYDVWQFEYPDDQAIHKSAAFLHQQLVQYQNKLTQNVQIIAHSMGGLVSRELLTHPEFQCRQCINQRPAISRLIMVGTPNHGSEMARFRLLSEVRDQLFSGDFHWLGGFVDGDGEAGKDLIPGSDFLQQLNSRPHPVTTNYLVIAGILADDELAEFNSQLKPLDELGKRARSLYIDTIDSVGDGLVSLESATLKGVRLYKVTGTHLSIIRNLMESSQRMPPAIPLILKILTRNHLQLTFVI